MGCMPLVTIGSWKGNLESYVLCTTQTFTEASLLLRELQKCCSGWKVGFNFSVCSCNGMCKNLQIPGRCLERPNCGVGGNVR